MGACKPIEDPRSKEEDLVRVLPLVRAHINALDRYHFELDESVTEGEIRPLRAPSVTDQYEFAFPEPDTRAR